VSHLVTEVARRTSQRSALAAYVAAVAAVVGLVTISLFFWVGQPWGTINDVAVLVMTAAVAPLMLAFWELGGWTPTPRGLLAQTAGWLARATWVVVHTVFIFGALTFDSAAPATDGLAIESVAQIVIGLWIGGASLLAGAWLAWQRWLGLLTGVGWALVGVGLLVGGMNHPLSYAGGVGYLLVFPVWAFLMGRLFSRIAPDAGRRTAGQLGMCASAAAWSRRPLVRWHARPPGRRGRSRTPRRSASSRRCDWRSPRLRDAAPGRR